MHFIISLVLQFINYLFFKFSDFFPVFKCLSHYSKVNHLFSFFRHFFIFITTYQNAFSFFHKKLSTLFTHFYVDNVDNFSKKCIFSTFFRFSNVDKLKTSHYFISIFFRTFFLFCAFCIFLKRYLSKPENRIINQLTHIVCHFWMFLQKNVLQIIWSTFINIACSEYTWTSHKFNFPLIIPWLCSVL